IAIANNASVTRTRRDLSRFFTCDMTCTASIYVLIKTYYRPITMAAQPMGFLHQFLATRLLVIFAVVALGSSVLSSMFLHHCSDFDTQSPYQNL
ncbi:MAG TPA: hypothetical protein VEL31_10100, partial [Ktedonobacteraceae bacterium]|nr:hypothetical protein [Ktedonobacteraceae bacterium]